MSETIWVKYDCTFLCKYRAELHRIDGCKIYFCLKFNRVLFSDATYNDLKAKGELITSCYLPEECVKNEVT